MTTKQFKDLSVGNVFMYAGNKYLATSRAMVFLEDGAVQDTLLSIMCRPISTMQDEDGNEFMSVNSNPDSHDGNYDIYCDSWIKVLVLRENARTREVLV